MIEKQKALAEKIDRINRLRKEQNKLLSALIMRCSMIEVTEYDVPRLKRAYDKAVKAQKESFFFKFARVSKPVELVTGYAKYMLEYLKTVKGGSK